MNIIFAGTSNFALSTLKILVNSNHNILAVYTQPDRPKGRGQKIEFNSIKQFAIENNLSIYQPETLKDKDCQNKFENLHSDIFVNVAYGLIIPDIILNIPKYGGINIHPSLLPMWRGAAPIQRAIMSGDKFIGITIMKMDKGLDTGPIYKQKILPIEDLDTTKSLTEKVSNVGSILLLDVLNDIENKKATLIEQNDNNCTYAKKISKQEGKINWNKSAKEIERMIRAFNPWPISFTEINGKNIRIWHAIGNEEENIIPNKIPGTIIYANKKGIGVSTKKGILNILKIQFPGKKPLDINDILNSYSNIFSCGKILQ